MSQGPTHWSQGGAPDERPILIRVVLAGFGVAVLALSIEQTEQAMSQDGSGWKHLIPGAILSAGLIVQAFAVKRTSVLKKVSLGLILLALVSMPLIGRPI